ncbi:MAG: flippase [Lachnospiraceae bacterium]|nr:flippase [Lachnospiraceae bacterium]
MKINLKEKNKSVEWNFVFYMLRTLMSLLYPLVTFSYTSRILGVEAIGNFNFVRSFSHFFVLIALLGVGRYGSREGAKIRENEIEFSRLAHELFFISFIATFIVVIIYDVCIFSLPNLQDYRQLLLIFTLTILLNEQLGLEWVYTANENFTYIAIRAVLFQIFGIAALFLFVKTPDDLWKYALIYIFATYGSVLLNYVNVRRYIYIRWLGNYHIVCHLKSLMYLMAVNISTSVYSDLDSVMLGLLSNDFAVGIYTAAVKLNRIVNSLISCFGTVAMPKLSYYYGNGRIREFNSLVKKGYSIVFMLSVPICVGMFMLSGEFIQLLSGNEFSAAGITAKILSPIILFIPFSSLTKEEVFIPMKKENFVLVVSFLGAGVNVITNSLLIPHFAENGAAVATVFAEGTVAVVSIVCARKVLHVSEIFAGYWRYWFAAVPIILIRYVGTWFTHSTIGVILFTVLFSAISYFIILWLLGDQLVRSTWSGITKLIKER